MLFFRLTVELNYFPPDDIDDSIDISHPIFNKLNYQRSQLMQIGNTHDHFI